MDALIDVYKLRSVQQGQSQASKQYWLSTSQAAAHASFLWDSKQTKNQIIFKLQPDLKKKKKNGNVLVRR